MRTLPRVLVRLAPLLLAFLLPYLTPGIQDRAPYVGAAWLQDDPGSWTGREVWVLIRLAPGTPLPEPDATVRLDALSDRMVSWTDRGAYLRLLPMEDGTAKVLASSWRPDRARIRWMGNLLAGVGLLLAAGILFRPTPCATVEVRPWIR